jgi:hypothetical protein
VVKGLTVKERGAGAAAGAGIGLGAGALFVGGVALLASAISGGGFPDSGDPMPPSDGSIAKFVAFFTVTPAIVGAMVGYFVGGRRTFDLDR